MNRSVKIGRRVAPWAAGVLLLGGCASVPPEISQAPAGNPELAQVSEQPDRYLGRAVRWGGLILSTENRTDATAVTLLAMPLGRNGKPQTGDASAGRFIALVPRFLEPTLYASDRKLTVRGVVNGSEQHKVGEFLYRYPVIAVDHYHLWPVEPVLSERDRYPWWWYDPWYDPWHPLYYPYRPFYH